MNLRPPRSTRTDTLFPYTTLFRSDSGVGELRDGRGVDVDTKRNERLPAVKGGFAEQATFPAEGLNLAEPGKLSDAGIGANVVSERELGEPDDQRIARDPPLLCADAGRQARSEERRVGKACVSTWRSRGSPYH